MAQNRVGIPGVQINNHTVMLVCGGNSIILPAPDFGNGEKYETLRINRRSRGGDLKIYRAAYWPRTKVLSMQWSYLNKPVRSQLLLFMRQNLGKQMLLYNYDYNIYTGVIRTPECEFTESQSGFHVLKLDFETE